MICGEVTSQILQSMESLMCLICVCDSLVNDE